jgi:hypothetical protein
MNHHDGPIGQAEILGELPDDEPEAPQDTPQEAPDAPILALLDAHQVVFAEPPPEPITVYSVNGQSIGTSGNLLVISAQAKGGKTALIIAMAALPFTTVEGRDFLGIESAPANGKSVVLFDTEQSPYHAWKNQTRILARAGCTAQPPELLHYSLRTLSITERRQAVMEGSRRAAATGPGVFAVFIDGVADLLEDVNDAVEANALVSDLVKLAVEIDAPVIVVLHENPAAPGPGGGSGKTRGHLGSQLERKAESNLRIVKDSDNVSTVFGEKCRTASIPQHSGPRFAWNDEAGMHISVEPAGVAKAEMAREKTRAEIDEIFDCPGALGGLPHKTIMDRIQEVLTLAPGGARKRFDKMKASGLIRKNSENLWIR